MKISIDENKCIACGTCEGLCPDCFKVQEGVATVINQECKTCDPKEVAQNCPVGAISVEE